MASFRLSFVSIVHPVVTLTSESQVHRCRLIGFGPVVGMLRTQQSGERWLGTCLSHSSISACSRSSSAIAAARSSGLSESNETIRCSR